MSALTAQLNDIDNEIESLLNRVDELTLKKNALEQLESTYDSTIELVKDTALLMTQAGLDPKSLAVDIRNLIAPRKTRKTSDNNSEAIDSDNDSEDYETIEVEETRKPAETPKPTLAPAPVVMSVTTQATKRTPAPTPAPVVISTKLKTYKVDPESLKTPVATPEPTPTPSEREKPVSTWTLDELKTFCSEYWHQSEIQAFIKGKGYTLSDKTGYILIVSRIKGKLNGLKTA